MSLLTAEGQRHASRWGLRRSRRSLRFKECLDSASTRRAEREGPIGKPIISKPVHLAFEQEAADTGQEFVDRLIERVDLTKREIVDWARHREHREAVETRLRIERECARQVPAAA